MSRLLPGAITLSFLDELGHSGLSHSIQRRHERNLTF